jgi:hypothetical protein
MPLLHPLPSFSLITERGWVGSFFSLIFVTIIYVLTETYIFDFIQEFQNALMSLAHSSSTALLEHPVAYTRQRTSSNERNAVQNV